MTNTEFKTKLTEAFKTHIFMKDRDCHTVNELLYVLEYHSGFNKEDFNISIKTLNNNWWSIPCLDAFVTSEIRGIWFNDADVEFEIEECDEAKYNCITIYEKKGKLTMGEKFEITKQTIPDYIMENLREGRGLDCMDISQDEEILKLDGWDFLNEWLSWEGILGYTPDIIIVVGLAFGIDFE